MSKLSLIAAVFALFAGVFDLMIGNIGWGFAMLFLAGLNFELGMRK